jgi:hypothetical protein
VARRRGRFGLGHITAILSAGERRTFNDLSRMIELGRRANAVMIEMLSSSSSLTALNEDIRLLEKQADQLSFAIRSGITGGAVNPNVLDNLLECVDLADSIVDDYFWVSRELLRISKVTFSNGLSAQTAEMETLLIKFLDLAEKGMMILLEMLRASNLGKITELRNDIELLEEEGDNIKDHGFDMLYASAQDMHYLQFAHLSEMLQKFDDILDSCEDMADLLVSITTTISR